MKRIHLQANIPPELANQRLDQALAQLFPDYSRSQWQSWIKDSKLQLNGKVCTKAKEKLRAHDQVELNSSIEVQGTWEAEEIPLDILYEDEALLVINKAVGLVVHPGAGNP
ncbi:MAG TPA: S4 domain-containing protein, partial [Coxiellaceae bacterium]|nr:S4 domain-containing protein [Coxiellaceae bacterium]